MGDRHRIPKTREKKFSDPEFEILLRVSPDKLKHKLSPFHIRPAYSYTKAEVGRVPNV